MPRITPNFWFDDQGLEAAEFYCSVFPNSKVGDVTHYPDSDPDRGGSVLTVNFELDGKPFTAINGGPQFTFDEAISLLIDCADQDEVDHYWEQLTEGGEEGPCGWCKDKFALSWQVCPVGWEAMLTSPDRAGVERAMQAMYAMKKLDLAALQAAFDGA